MADKKTDEEDQKDDEDEEHEEDEEKDQANEEEDDEDLGDKNDPPVGPNKNGAISKVIFLRALQQHSEKCRIEVLNGTRDGGQK